MTLTLRIDNYDMLEDGGPAWITLDRKGASVGRSRAMDWVLPDPAKHISGHHFDITFRDGNYWLTDVSTNGTFLEGERHRLDGPRQLHHGDRLVVGHYVITSEVSSGQGPSLQTPPMGRRPASSNTPQGDDPDPWDFGAGSLDPVNPIPPQRADPHHMDDVAQDFVPLQRPRMADIPQMPTPPLAQPFDHASPSQPYPGAARFADGGPPPSVPPVFPQSSQTGPPASAPMPPLSPQAAPPAALSQTQPQPLPAGGTDQPGTAPSGTPTSPDNTAIMQAFCEGAGLSTDLPGRTDPEALARELGRSVRIATEEIMRLLQDRANVKQFTKGGERTMRSATGNNPLKFLPDGDKALEAMFLNPRDGFMTGADGFENALKDLRLHQMAVFAALQPALANLLEGLSPDEIEAASDGTGNLLGGSRRAKAWDSYVSRWDEKARTGDHGMLDAFLKAFAQAYSDAIAKGDIT